MRPAWILAVSILLLLAAKPARAQIGMDTGGGQALGGAGVTQGAPDRGNPWDSIGNRRGDGSAIHDLEDMTGQKIGTFHSSSAGGGDGGGGGGGQFSGMSLAQDRAAQIRYNQQLLQLERQQEQQRFRMQMTQQVVNAGVNMLVQGLFSDNGPSQAQIQEQQRLEALRRAEEERRRREEEERQRRERVSLAARQRRAADEREADFAKGLDGVFAVGSKKSSSAGDLPDDADDDPFGVAGGDLRDAPRDRREPPVPIIVPARPPSRMEALLTGLDDASKKWLGVSPKKLLDDTEQMAQDAYANLTSKDAWKIRGEGAKGLLGDQAERVADGTLEERFGLPGGGARNVYKGGEWLSQKTIGGLDKAADLAHHGTDGEIREFTAGYNERTLGSGFIQRATGSPDVNARENGESLRKLLTGTAGKGE